MKKREEIEYNLTAFLREEGGTAQAVTEGECGILKLV